MPTAQHLRLGVVRVHGLDDPGRRVHGRIGFRVLFALTGRHAGERTPGRLADLSWLSGGWSTNQGPMTIEEHWTGPSDNALIGMGRTLRDGKIPRRTWILYFDTSLEDEWEGIWDDTPPPPSWGEEE